MKHKAEPKRAPRGRRLVIGLVMGSVLALAGCAGWRAPKETPVPASPPEYLQSDLAGDYIDEPWWIALGDTTLSHLMTDLFASSLTLEQAAARLDQFRALSAAANSTWVPWASGQAGITEAAVLKPGTAPVIAPVLATPRFGISLTAAYEIDLWGKLSAGRAAAHADLLATEDNLRALALSLSAQLGRTYYQVLELRLLRDLLDDTVRSYEATYDIVSDRYTSGIVPSVDVYQAASNLAGTRAQRALVESGLATAEHALAVLLGRYPERGLIPVASSMPIEVPDIPAGLPSELVQRRPDVLAAYWRLLAADRRAAEAVADRFPRFSLTASIGGRSNDLAGAVDPTNVVWSAVGNLVGPIFEGGRRKANADRAAAAWREQAAAYQAAVLDAFREVEDALVRGTQQSIYLQHLESQVQATEASLRQARIRYLQGLTSYLPVEVAQAVHLNTQSSLISARRGLIDARIQLATALGGGWTDPWLNKTDSISGEFPDNN